MHRFGFMVNYTASLRSENTPWRTSFKTYERYSFAKIQKNEELRGKKEDFFAVPPNFEEEGLKVRKTKNQHLAGADCSLYKRVWVISKACGFHYSLTLAFGE